MSVFQWMSAKTLDGLYIWPCILVTEVLVYSSYGIFINLSRKDGNLECPSSSIWLGVEVLKLFVASFLAWPEIVHQKNLISTFKNILPFSIPALCYCINNNLSVYMQNQMDPATYQVLSNLKIASTAVFYRLIIKRKLRKLHWFSLGILMFAGGLNSYTGLRAKSRSVQDINISLLGIVMIIIYCSVSGFAGVFTEYILKKDAGVPLALQNCYMYIFGVILNSLLMVYQSGNIVICQSINRYTLAAIISQTVNGLTMSFIMKYSSNITRLVVISSAVPVTTGLSVIVFHMKVGFEFYLVIFLVVLALCMYNCSSQGAHSVKKSQKTSEQELIY